MRGVLVRCGVVAASISVVLVGCGDLAPDLAFPTDPEAGVFEPETLGQSEDDIARPDSQSIDDFLANLGPTVPLASREALKSRLAASQCIEQRQRGNGEFSERTTPLESEPAGRRSRQGLVTLEYRTAKGQVHFRGVCSVEKQFDGYQVAVEALDSRDELELRRPASGSDAAGSSPPATASVLPVGLEKWTLRGLGGSLRSLRRCPVRS